MHIFKHDSALTVVIRRLLGNILKLAMGLKVDRPISISGFGADCSPGLRNLVVAWWVIWHQFGGLGEWRPKWSERERVRGSYEERW